MCSPDFMQFYYNIQPYFVIWQLLSKLQVHLNMTSNANRVM